MSEIKDIVDLCIQLRNERRESWVAPVVERIQSLALSLQSAQLALIDKQSESAKENIELHRKIFQMEQDHVKAVSALTDKHRKEIAERDAKIAEFQSDAPGVVVIGTKSIFADDSEHEA
jgi:copper oxidase (laccase) domain-containing protein